MNLIGGRRAWTVDTNLTGLYKQILGYFREPVHTHSRFALTIFFFLSLVVAPRLAKAQTFTLSSAPGGITLTPAGSNYAGSFGTLNALGIGTPAAGVTVIPVGGGALYRTTYQLAVTGLVGTHKAGVTGYASTNFAHPTALIMESCPSTSACNTSGVFSAMSTSSATPTTVVAAPGIPNSTVTAGLAIFVPDNNGASAFAGTDSAVITLNMTDLTNNKPIGTVTISLNSPSETLQTSVQLTLATAPGGVTIAAASDYSLSFSNVNGLGIGPLAGLTTTSVSGGIVYATPYLLQPAFSNFSSTTSTLSVYVSSNFAHSAILQADDATASGGPFSAISTSAGSPTQITTSAASRSSVTRYLGLFVSNINGPTAITGADTATLTFTLTVP